MLLLDFINNNPDWESILSGFPYDLAIKRKDDYILLSYEIGSDFSNPIVQQARGAIFKKDKNGKYQCVCRAFDKFFNHNENNAAKIDWASAIVREKVDGSLIKLWFDNGWHISTNGAIDAFENSIDETKITFGQLFLQAFNEKNIHEFLAGLNPEKTYMFELVSPIRTLVVRYPDTALYYLGERDMITEKESYEYTDKMKSFGIKAPKIYNLNSLKGVVDLVNAFGDDEEGCVVCDKNFNRIKVKGQAYLKAFFFRCQANISTKRIIEAMKTNTIDDWSSYSPEAKEKYNSVLNKLKCKAIEFEGAYDASMSHSFSNQKEFALFVKEKYPQYSGFIFTKQKQPDLNGFDYILSLSMSSILRLLGDEEYV